VGDVEAPSRQIAAGHEGDGWAATEDVEEREEEEQRANAQDGARHAAAISVVVHGSISFAYSSVCVGTPSPALRVSGWAAWKPAPHWPLSPPRARRTTGGRCWSSRTFRWRG